MVLNVLHARRLRKEFPGWKVTREGRDLVARRGRFEARHQRVDQLRSRLGNLDRALREARGP